MRAAIVAMAVTLLAAPGAEAHEGGMHAKGVVKAITAERLTVGTAQGEKTFDLTPATSYVRGAAPARREDLRAGERVVVHARQKDGRLEATEVRAGPAKRAAPAP